MSSFSCLCFCLPLSDSYYEDVSSCMFLYAFPPCILVWPGGLKEALLGPLPGLSLAICGYLFNLFHLGLTVGPGRFCTDGQPPFSGLLFSICKVKAGCSLLPFAIVDRPIHYEDLHTPSGGFGLGPARCPQNVREAMSELYL